jgi:hypothetical protein
MGIAGLNPRQGVCAPCLTIQEIVLPIRRRVTYHNGIESNSLGPQPNGHPETNDDENEEDH